MIIAPFYRDHALLLCSGRTCNKASAVWISWQPVKRPWWRLGFSSVWKTSFRRSLLCLLLSAVLKEVRAFNERNIYVKMSLCSSDILTRQEHQYVRLQINKCYKCPEYISRNLFILKYNMFLSPFLLSVVFNVCQWFNSYYRIYDNIIILVCRTVFT